MQPNGYGVEVAPGHSAVGGKTLGVNKKVPLLRRQALVVGGQESADVGQSVLLGRHGAAVRVGEQLPSDLDRAPSGVTVLPELDEVGVFGEPAGVDIQWDPIFFADPGYGPYIGHRDRLTPTGVVGDGQHAERDPLGTYVGNQPTQGVHIHVAFERVAGGG